MTELSQNGDKPTVRRDGPMPFLKPCIIIHCLSLGLSLIMKPVLLFLRNGPEAQPKQFLLSHLGNIDKN